MDQMTSEGVLNFFTNAQIQNILIWVLSLFGVLFLGFVTKELSASRKTINKLSSIIIELSKDQVREENLQKDIKEIKDLLTSNSTTVTEIKTMCFMHHGKNGGENK